MQTIDEAADEWIAEGVSITRVVLLGDEELAARMVRNVFDAHEFQEAIHMAARLEVLRLNDKLARYCCEKGEAIGMRDTCCPECAAISDGYSEAMGVTPNDQLNATGVSRVAVEAPVGREED